MTPEQVKERVEVLDKALDDFHDNHDKRREGHCWCCCLMCDEDYNDDLPQWVTEYRKEYWHLVGEQHGRSRMPDDPMKGFKS